MIESTRVLRLYQHGELDPSSSKEYLPLTPGALPQLAVAAPSAILGSSELSVAVGILGIGEAEGVWTWCVALRPTSRDHTR